MVRLAFWQREDVVLCFSSVSTRGFCHPKEGGFRPDGGRRATRTGVFEYAGSSLPSTSTSKPSLRSAWIVLAQALRSPSGLLCTGLDRWVGGDIPLKYVVAANA